MKKTYLMILMLAFAWVISSCGPKTVSMPDEAPGIASPDGKLTLKVAVIDGIPYYELYHADKAVILPSRLGFDLVSGGCLSKDFTLSGSSQSSLDETWEPVWGEEDKIRNHYNELLVNLHQKDGPAMNIRFRLYDDGLGFRYEFPLENSLVYFNIKEELTQFALAGDHTAWWIPGDYSTQEYSPMESKLSEIRGLYDNACKDYGWPYKRFSPTGVQTALQMKTDDGLYINIHEAAVLDYPTTNLDLDDKNFVLSTHLTPDAEGIKGRLQAPCHTPWRSVMVCESATEVLASRLVLNLNEPCAIEDVSWIHPVKYMGVWWEMMTGAATWNYADYQAIRLGETDYTKLKPTGRHAANNDNVRRYIDFAARHGFDQLLVEGWNQGWEDLWQKYHNFSFTQSYPDFDVKALQAYANGKGIKLMMHHETSSSIINYERQLQEAYKFAHDNGYDVIKSGYVGNIFPYGGHHYDQWMNNHYLYCVT